MAESDDQERTEQPSEKHLQEARDKGDVPHSHDLSAAVVLLVGAVTVALTRSYMGDHLLAVLHRGLQFKRGQWQAPDAMLQALVSAMADLAWAAAPVFVATWLACFGAPLLLGGLHVSKEALQFKPERLDPISGIGKLFTLSSLFELAKALLKVLLIGGVLVAVLWASRDTLLALGRGEVPAGILSGVTLVSHAWIGFVLALCGIAAVDLAWQRYDYDRRMRMTRKELKDEQKETEGSPEMRGHLRRMQMQMARRRMMAEVPKASVVVVNPEHFAVALLYKEDSMRSPKVIAKGVELIAGQIREIASEHKIPMIQAPALARALYHTTPLGADIPSALYLAVAQLLAYLMRLKLALDAGQQPPPPPDPKIDPKLLGPYQQ